MHEHWKCFRTSKLRERGNVRDQNCTMNLNSIFQRWTAYTKIGRRNFGENHRKTNRNSHSIIRRWFVEDRRTGSSCQGNVRGCPRCYEKVSQWQSTESIQNHTETAQLGANSLHLLNHITGAQLPCTRVLGEFTFEFVREFPWSFLGLQALSLNCLPEYSLQFWHSIWPNDFTIWFYFLESATIYRSIASLTLICTMPCEKLYSNQPPL